MKNKKFSCWLIGALFMWSAVGCKKEAQYEFVINCKVPPGFHSSDDPLHLVATDASGRIIEAFKIGDNELEFQRTVLLDAGTQTCNIHLGVRYSQSPVGLTVVRSHLDVENGALVVIEPSLFAANGSLLEQKAARVNGITSFDSLGFLGGQTIHSVYEAEHLHATTTMHFLPFQAGILHGKANGASEYRYLYMSEGLLDSLYSYYETEWSQFKPVPASRSVATAPNLPPANEMLVDAITPDFQHFVSIGPARHIAPQNPQFIQPEEAPDILRIRLSGESFAAEQIFQPGEMPAFAMTDMQIGNISATLGKGFKIEASGDIDLLEVDCTESTYYNWKIQGRPASFKDVTMPTLAELSKHISFKNSPTPFRRFKVRAHQFGAHDYPEVREGFPFRSSELFPVAQSGYFMLEKAFE